jgi:Ca2+-transporting ATPase
MWHSIDKREVLERLGSNEGGLSSKEASLRLEKYGKNELVQVKGISPVLIFFEQFKSVLILILIAAAIFSLLIQHYLDFAVIIAIVLVNSIIGFVEQYKAEKTISEMKQMLVPVVKVMRDGILREISSLELVPGDVIFLSEGDKVTADARIIKENELQTNEAILTGESFPQDKSSVTLPLDTILANMENMVYMGTTIVRGSAHAVVVATNMETEFGKIASLVQTIKSKKTPLEEKLDSFSKRIALIVLILAAITTLIGIFQGEEAFKMMLAGIALAVAVIPEGLPAVIAITLALAIRRLKYQNALIRKLPAAETLGRVTVICTDKTGTLTEENMSVTNLFADNRFSSIENGSFFQEGEEINPKAHKGITALLRTGILCNNARIEIEGNSIKSYGDPTEKALIMSAYKSGMMKKEETEKEIRVKEYSFSSSRKMMSIVRKKGGKFTSYVKGAPDFILKGCTHELKNGRIFALTPKRRAELHAAYETMAAEALRVLGFAFKPVSANFNQNIAETGLIFVGFQGMLDAPRKEVKASIADCKTAGIKVKMITGDSLITANAISKMIGLEGESTEESELTRLSESEFDACVAQKSIFARITPETKLKIIQSLKKQKEIVAVTGDGINDVLALKEAHIGVAMGIRGSDVARDVSDIILLDDNFSTIVQATREGRRVYDNMKKSIKSHVSANAGELFVVLIALLMYLPLPILPLAILWMNLVTDSLPSLALTVEKEEKDIMRRKPINHGNSILGGIWKFTLAAGIMMFVAAMIAFLIYYQLDLDKARTMTLTTAIFAEMFIVLACRSEKPLKEIGFFSNKFLLASIAIAIVLQLIAIYTPLANVFGFVPLSLKELGIVLVLSAPIFIIFEIAKYLKPKV